MSDLLHVSKSLLTTLSFQMETLYSQISPRVTVAGGPVPTAQHNELWLSPRLVFACPYRKEKRGVDSCSYR